MHACRAAMHRYVDRWVAWVSAFVVVSSLACSSSVEPDGDSGSGSGATGTTGSGPSGSGGGGPDFGACSTTSTCVLASPGCCGTCGPLTLDQVEPIGEGQQQAFLEATCPDPGGTPCPGCASFPNGNLYAYCDGSQCQEGDLTLTEFSECTQASECTLRWGSGCCEGCSGSWEPGFGGDLVAIAVSKVGAFTDLVCGDQDIGCPACGPEYPPGAFADCVAGRCVVGEAQAGGDP